ncbi:hypothetical protein [Streptomyces sp. NPDC059533]|uniref:hypothetical protein n=1 Tax=unclassified Streptomyces TaxID=2593676 RepID=UPI00369670F1
MRIQPRDAALDDAEWRPRIADGHDWYDDHEPVEQRTDTARRLAERGTAPDAPTAARHPRRLDRLDGLDRVGTWKP